MSTGHATDTDNDGIDFDSLSDEKLILAAVLIDYASLTIDESDDFVLPRLRQITEFVSQLEFLESELSGSEQLHYAVLDNVFHLANGKRFLDVSLAA